MDALGQAKGRPQNTSVVAKQKCKKRRCVCDVTGSNLRSAESAYFSICGFACSMKWCIRVRGCHVAQTTSDADIQIL
eukprot:6211937-Pleurochrysis_carterae.AAC.3